MKAGSCGLYILLLLVRGGVRIKRKSNENKCNHYGDDEGTDGAEGQRRNRVELPARNTEEEPSYVPIINFTRQYLPC
jgi:hypothetical protein